MVIIAVFSFLLIFLFAFPFPLIVLFAGITGYFGGKISSSEFNIIRGHENAAGLEKGLIDDFISDKRPSSGATFKTALIWTMVWLVPILILFLITGKESTFYKEAVFFSKAALVTFGGAYSVLAFIAQKAVDEFHWLYPGEMLDGLGMAESTPGPLIQVVQFVGFMGAFRDPGILGPVMSGIIASFVVTWVTYAPCFLYIFTGGPYIEYVRGNKDLNAALSGITAAVVGVIVNLSIWFAVHTLFYKTFKYQRNFLQIEFPVPESFSLENVGLTTVALISYFGLNLGMFRTILITVAGGVILYLIRNFQLVF
jgi:chromate transporter